MVSLSPSRHSRSSTQSSRESTPSPFGLANCASLEFSMKERPKSTSLLAPQLAGSILWGFFLSCLTLGFFFHRPPRPLPESAPFTLFSAERALKHVEKMSTQPHPTGSPANRKLRIYLMDTLRKMRLEVKLKNDTVINGSMAGNPETIIARIPGTHSTGAFAVVAHYDSTPYGPGAADDLAGVSAMLEAGRALLEGPPLRNDLLLVFTDGEESGGLGAISFTMDPWYEDVRILFNLEARGVGGPSYLFETSDPLGCVVPECCQASSWVVGSACMFGPYRLSPFGSDFSAFRDTKPGMNAAFIDFMPYYHTINDLPGNMDLASLQHHGTYIVDFAHYFGNRDFSLPLSRKGYAYFNVFGRHMVCTPLSWNVPLTLTTALLLFSFLFIAYRKGLISPSGVAQSSLLLGILLFLSFLFALITVLVGLLFMRVYMIYQETLFTCASVAILVATWTGLHARISRKVGEEDLLSAVWLLWCLPLLLFTFAWPGAVHLFQWPLLFLLCARLLLLSLPSLAKNPWLVMTVLALGSAPLLFLSVTPLAALSSAALALGLPFTMLFAAFVYLPLFPQLGCLSPRAQSWACRGAFTLCTCFVIAALIIGGPSEKRPTANCVAYYLDADKGEAFWASPERRLDPWTRQIFGDRPERGNLPDFGLDFPFMKTEAPLPFWPPPLIRVVSDQKTKSERLLRLHISSPRGAPDIRLFTEKDQTFSVIEVNGLERKQAAPTRRFLLKTMPQEGMELVLKMRNADTLRLKLIETSYALPSDPLFRLPARPINMMPEPNTMSNWRKLRSEHCHVLKTYTF